MKDQHVKLGERCCTLRSNLMAASAFALLTVPSAALAQEGERDGRDRIVVTAEKQGRTLLETSTSVTVLDEEDLLARSGLAAVSDILTRLPNANSFGKSGIAPTVRGVDGTGPGLGATAFLAGARNRLNIQVDGRALSFNEVAYGDTQIWDVGQVEVLRGPQSTLQGRNAVGGTIAIATKNPTYEFEASARGQLGTQSLRHGSVALSGPIIADQVAVRVAVDHREYDAFVDMVPTVYGNDNPEHYTATTIRGKVLVEPQALAGLKALFTVQYGSFEGPQVERVARPFDDRVSALGDGEPVHKPKNLSGIADISYELSDNVTFQNVFSYTDFSFDRFARSAPARVDGKELVWEPRIYFSLDNDRLNGIIGGYYFDAEQNEEIAFVVDSFYRDETTTKAAFGELNYDITERFHLVLGGRYEEEKRIRRDAGPTFFSVDLDQTTSVFLPKAGISYDLSDSATVGVIASRGYNGGGAGFTFEPPFLNFAFDPEFVWNYEVYTRANLSEGLFVTANVFYSDYKDMQIPFDNNPDPALMSQVILNADEVTTYGAEFGARWSPAEFVELHGEIGLLHTDINSPGSIVDGNELTRAADVTGNIGGVYRNPDGIEFAADVSYSGGYFSDELNDPRGYINPYWSANAQIAYNWKSARFHVSVTNLFDESNVTAILPGPVMAADHGFLAQGRRVIGGVQVNF